MGTIIGYSLYTICLMVVYFVGRYVGKKNLSVVDPSDIIWFSDEFYDQLNYFMNDYSKVYAVNKDETKHELHNGTSSTAEKYFKKVQAGYEQWLKLRYAEKANAKSNTNESSKSRIKF